MIDHENIFDNLKLIYTSKPNWEAELISAIGGVVSETADPFRQILYFEKNVHNCVTVILEKEYVDEDYLDEFSYFYSKTFRIYSDKCVRLHFFRCKIDFSNIVDLEKYKDDYLGFSVVRPTISFRTGRTILKPPFDDGHKHFILCKSDFPLNLSGNSLQTRGMPFAQQDTNVNVCAQACLWMTSLYMHEKYGYPRYRPSQITDLATKYFTIGPVREGLTPNQMLAALKEMGYNTVIFKNISTEDTAKIVYGYVESEIPVILLLAVGENGHAVTVIGHDFHVMHNMVESWDSNINWIRYFYIHDDASGPYQKISIYKERNLSIFSIEKNVAYVIAPIPHEVTLQVNDVYEHVKTLMKNINRLFDFFEDSSDLKLSAKELSGLIFRTYLRRQNDFKTSLPDDMNEYYKILYKATRMPKYVWVTEISTKDLINHERSNDRKMVGEILIDSTADRHSRLGSYLAIHLYGRLILKKPEEQVPFALYADLEEKSYSHLVRQP